MTNHKQNDKKTDDDTLIITKQDNKGDVAPINTKDEDYDNDHKKISMDETNLNP